MPTILSTKKKACLGEMLKVESDVKPAFRGAKVVPWYYAVIVSLSTNPIEKQCLLMTEAEFKNAKRIKVTPETSARYPLGCFVSESIFDSIALSHPESGEFEIVQLFKSQLERMKARAIKYPHLLLQKKFFGLWFS